jgi:hypothetical protein
MIGTKRASPVAWALLSLLAIACSTTAGESGDDTQQGVSGADPRTSVTDPKQVERFNCLKDSRGRVYDCSTAVDHLCPDGMTCDKSGFCECCVPIPQRPDPSRDMHSYAFSACQDGACALPFGCFKSDDPAVCSMIVSTPTFATPFQSTAANVLADTRRQICATVRPNQDCMWSIDFPGGTYFTELPFPESNDHPYECGGRSCNGVEKLLVRPASDSGTAIAHLVVDGCHGGS